MDDLELKSLTLSQAAEAIRKRELSPRELVEACISRIERLNPRINAFLTVMTSEVLREANHAEGALARGEVWGPLHGVPIAVKDLIDVAGERTTAGSLFFRDRVADADAEVVRLLRAAGAIIIGKAHLHEFAIGVTNVNPHYGPARNPWNLDFSPGGSSGGSAAAVAASMCLGALGTDTGGSVRVPAALCNLTGLRPGKARVSTEGVVPMSWTLDTVGPLAHTAEDVALLVDAIDGQPLTPARCIDHLQEPLPDLRIGVPEDDYFWLETDYQVVGAVRQAIDRITDLGLVMVSVNLPMMKEVLRASGIISLSDAAAYHKERLETSPEKFGEDVRARLEWGIKRTGAEYAQALQTGLAWQATLRALFREQVDVLLLPTTPMPGHVIEGSEGLAAAREMLRFTYPFSLSGLPSLSLPCGFTEDDLPVGLQFVAPAEATLLQLAHAYQKAAPWYARRPDL
jgi:aspartyl-tRNA(Asn)/glutamyl-tRNA(Gln) amidotransferase subunit A